MFLSSPVNITADFNLYYATGKGAHLATTDNNATYIAGRNDHLFVNNGPLAVTTAPSSGSGTGGSGTGDPTCPRGDMVVEHIDKGVVRIDEVIVGDKDVGTPVAMSRAIHDAIPGSKLVIIPSASHLSNLEQPELFNKALLSFLSKHG